MPMFVLLTRLSPELLQTPHRVEDAEREVSRQVRAQCPEVEWICNAAILGPHDYLDIFRAPDVETASKVATIVRLFGHAHTETWAAIEWDRYKELLRELPSHEVLTAFP